MLNMFRSSAPRFTAKEAIARKGEVTLIDVREAAEVKASGLAAGAITASFATNSIADCERSTWA